MKKIFLMFVLLIAACLAAAKSDPALFEQANQLYDQGQYAQALTTYQNFQQQAKIESSELYQNMGNAAFRNHELGKAIFYFRMANELDPSNGNIRYNLNFARSKTIDKINGPSLTLTIPFSTPWLISLIALFLTLTLLLSARRLFRPASDLLRWSRLIAAIVLFLAIVLLSVRALTTTSFGVVTTASTSVYSANSYSSVVLFTLNEGAEFKILEQLSDPASGTNQERWVKIELLDGKKGWINQKFTMLQSSAQN